MIPISPSTITPWDPLCIFQNIARRADCPGGAGLVLLSKTGDLLGRGFALRRSAISGGMWLGSAERGEIRRRDSLRAL